MALFLDKVRFDTYTYDLPANAVQLVGDSLTITFSLPEGKTYDEIEGSITDVDRIEIIDQTGAVVTAYNGYNHLSSLTKQNDYLLGRVKKEPAAEEAPAEDSGYPSEPVDEYEDVRGTVMIAQFKQNDLRQQVNDLQDTVDMLLLDNLGGGLG